LAGAVQAQYLGRTGQGHSHRAGLGRTNHVATAKLSAIVLAAGSNRRFAGSHSKLLAEWRGHTLIEYVLEAACNARVAGLVSEVLVVVPAAAPRLKSLVAASGCQAVSVPQDGARSASLRAGIGGIDPAADGAVILLGDQPMVTQRAIRAVVERASGAPRALVRTHYRGLADPVSHPALIGRDHFHLVHRMQEEEGFHAATERLGLRWVEVAADGDNPDVDYVHDLSRLG
jgi:molybdenum cofactor cytidylyltransferase